MIGTDAQSAGVGAFLLALIVAATTFGKGVWDMARDSIKLRREGKQGQDARSVQLIEVTQEGLMALNERLTQDNTRLRADLTTAEGKITVLKTELDSVRSDLTRTQRDLGRAQQEAASLHGMIDAMQRRLDRLETSGG